MALKIRLRKQGRTNRPFYRLVVTDSRSPRDGKYIENLGWYNPQAHNDDSVVLVKGDRVMHWVEQGAQMTEKAEALVRREAPAVLKAQTERLVARRKKAGAKRKKRRQAAKAA